MFSSKFDPGARTVWKENANKVRSFARSLTTAPLPVRINATTLTTGPDVRDLGKCTVRTAINRSMLSLAMHNVTCDLLGGLVCLFGQENDQCHSESGQYDCATSKLW